MKIKVISKAHLKGTSKKTDNPYDFIQVHYNGPARGVGDLKSRGRNPVPVRPRSPAPYIAGWSSLVAHRAHNPKVVGSNPAPATTPTVSTKQPCNRNAVSILVRQVCVPIKYISRSGGIGRRPGLKIPWE